MEFHHVLFHVQTIRSIQFWTVSMLFSHLILKSQNLHPVHTFYKQHFVSRSVSIHLQAGNWLILSVGSISYQGSQQFNFSSTTWLLLFSFKWRIILDTNRCVACVPSPPGKTINSLSHSSWVSAHWAQGLPPIHFVNIWHVSIIHTRQLGWYNWVVKPLSHLTMNSMGAPFHALPSFILMLRPTDKFLELVQRINQPAFNLYAQCFISLVSCGVSI